MVIKLVCVCTGVCRVSEPPVSPQGLPACTAPNRSQCRRGDDSDVGPPPLMAGADDGVPEHEVREWLKLKTLARRGGPGMLLRRNNAAGDTRERPT